MLNYHSDIVKQMQRNEGLLPATQSSPLGYKFNAWERRLLLITAPPECKDVICSHCLPDHIVYDILSRYQGLRVLEDLWLERQLIESDYISAEVSLEPDHVIHSYRSLKSRHEHFQDKETPSRRPFTPETADYTDLNADQRARFHAAVTYVWLLNEIRWVLTNFAYPVRFSVQIRLLEKCKAQIAGQRREALLDELDQHAVFKFMYHHLLPLHGLQLGDGTISELPFTFASDFTKGPAQFSRYVDTHKFRGD
jgi:hypothetical protein